MTASPRGSPGTLTQSGSPFPEIFRASFRLWFRSTFNPSFCRPEFHVQETSPRRRTDRAAANRLLIVAGVALLWALAIFGRLGYLQLVRHSDYLARAQRQQQRTIEITPQRGVIYDRGMHPLAMSVAVKSAFAVPAEIRDESLAAHLLSGIVNVPEDVTGANARLRDLLRGFPASCRRKKWRRWPR